MTRDRLSLILSDMKRILIFIFASAFLSGCNEAVTVNSGDYTKVMCIDKVEKFTYEGHCYILFHYNSYSAPVVHDPDCPCFKKE